MPQVFKCSAVGCSFLTSDPLEFHTHTVPRWSRDPEVRHAVTEVGYVAPMSDYRRVETALDLLFGIRDSTVREVVALAAQRLAEVKERINDGSL